MLEFFWINGIGSPKVESTIGVGVSSQITNIMSNKVCRLNSSDINMDQFKMWIIGAEFPLFWKISITKNEATSLQKIDFFAKMLCSVASYNDAPMWRANKQIIYMLANAIFRCFLLICTLSQTEFVRMSTLVNFA